MRAERLERSFLLLRNFVLNGQESASNPLLRIHAKHLGYAESPLRELRRAGGKRNKYL